jgi:radical SAM protein with 4Fe4S-binding SPASM domain
MGCYSQGKLDKRLDTVDSISLSFASKERFATTRIGGDYDKIVQNMKGFIALNERHIPTQVSMVKTTDEDVRQFISEWTGIVDRVRIYEEHSKDGKFGSLKREGDRKPCAKVVSQMAIAWDGSVRRCNHDWEGKPIGDVVSNTIAQVWNGEAYNDLRVQHQSVITDETCEPCGSWYERTK